MQVRKYLLVVSFLIGCTPFLKAQNITTQQYIATYKNVAIEEMRRSGVPAAIKLAQGIVETQSGNGTLCLQSNNHFGIKCKNTWTGKTIRYDDDARQECFRVYDSARESYKDHSDFLRSNPRYAFLFQFDGDDYKSWAYGLKQAGYATNKTYPQQLIKIIEENNLQQYTLIALGKAAPESAYTEPPVYAGNNPRKPETKPTTPRNNGGYNKPVVINYPKGVFEINGRRAMYVKAGTSLIQLAAQQDIRLRKLVRFNDLEDDRPLPKDMIIFLQKKSKRGNKEYHTVASGESMHDIAQAEGLQLRWLRRRNKLHEGEEPAYGQRLNLEGYAGSAPALAKNNRVLREEDQAPPEDFSPRKAIEDMKAETAKHNTGGAAVPETRPSASGSGVPPAMVEDLKKVGEVTSGNQPAPRPATPQPQPAPSQPAPAPVAGAQYHDVQPKETLYGIARMYNKSITQIQEWNNLQGFDIKIGQRLLVNK
ncbi:glucosaminidase domain-containing protein [Chitinophaga nivalis]|uniref:Peptidoglycan hydrolase n=1 Tax=Chitinophaga nivalis TaxID=2991709 RepID=A0ABT3ISK3_9BACT|nr:glucosaminidase domain-containing protein [Chitinophaga nivalis]MCW3463357.1 glucosaminidase domain-containing protein [Chitinophaga nivalis]MCW3486953.1 glucosaminidase domain-containing protein [Chitinophaga nivalis]